MRAARHLLNPLRWLVQPPSRVVGAMSLKPTDRVLEVGCGPGWFSPHLAAAVHRGSLACADAQPGMLRLAGTRLAGRPNASMHAADACALPFVDASFDAVLLAHVLGEVADPVACMREARAAVGVRRAPRRLARPTLTAWRTRSSTDSARSSSGRPERAGRCWSTW
ncbi:MAG: class I SAM-dependent methyltransferase [Actinobacteria bacterium]|nr:class I SAM-dependent methyltransferase [Actinomycetota bacterium]